MNAYIADDKGIEVDVRVLNPATGQYSTGAGWSAIEAEAAVVALTEKTLVDPYKSDYIGAVTIPAGTGLLLEYVNHATGEVLGYDPVIDPVALLPAYLDGSGLIMASALSSGIITSAVDISPELLSTFPSIIMEKGEKRTLRFWILENGEAKDCTGLTFKFGVKQRQSDSAYKLGPVDGVLSVDSDGVNSIVTFVLNGDLTKDLATFKGYYSVVSFDAIQNKQPLTRRDGVPYQLVAPIIDVHSTTHGSGEAVTAAGGDATAEVT